MASGITLSALTINAEEAKTLSSAVERIFMESPVFNQVFTTFTGYDKKTQLLLADELGLTGIIDSGGARPESGNLKAALAEKFIQVVNIGDTLIHTQSDVNQNFKPAIRKFANDFKELQITDEIGQFIIAAIMQAILEARWRLAMLGDTSATLIADGGNILPTSAIKFFTPLNGFWKQAFAGVTAATTPRYTIAENVAITKSLQLTLAADAGIKALAGMYKNAHANLKSKTDKYFVLTPELYYNYEEYLINQPATNGGLTDAMINGVPVLKYKGIPVYKDDLVGSILKTSQAIDKATTLATATTATNYTSIHVVSTAGFPEKGSISIGTDTFVYTSKDATHFLGASQAMTVNALASAVTMTEQIYNYPNRGFMTCTSNLGFYTVADSDFMNVESFYYEVARANYMAYLFAMDVKIHREQLVSVAY